ncbi:MAG: ROK family protein [Clostridia bacterium]|nr:ROK family protein [Clostridia bacterium]
MYTIGIDLGGTNIAVGLCDDKLNMIDKESVKTHAERTADEIVADMASVSKLLIDRNNLNLSDIEYVGILVPGTVRAAEGVVECTPNLPFSGLKLRETFKNHLPVERVYIENDANAAALAEALVGAGKGAGSLVMITLGTGVGGGIVLDGKIFRGGLNDFGAELGHTVIVAGGVPCGCGRRGCWESYSSATALKRMTAERVDELRKCGKASLMLSEPKISARTAFNCAKAGDTEAKHVVDEYIFYLATGIANVINVFQPEIVLIGGGVCGEGEYLTRPLTELVNSEQYTRDQRVKTKILTASLGNDAGIIGAAALGR